MTKICKLSDFAYFRCRKNSKISATQNGYHDAKVCNLSELQVNDLDAVNILETY